MLNIDQIQQKIELLANRIQAPADLIPTYGFSKQDGTPHIEVNDRTCCYVSTEHGVRTLDRKASSLDILLYWVFKDITFRMATAYAKAHPDPKVDPKKVRFDHQLSLLEVIDRDWKVRREGEIAEILKVSPYRQISYGESA